MTDKRTERIAVAREWLEQNTDFRWATEPEDDVRIATLNRRMRKRAEQMADFSLEVEQKWVAVSERLPTEDGDYLVRNAGGNCQVHRWNGCSWLENHGSPPEWMNEKAFSHWLPIPPKEEV